MIRLHTTQHEVFSRAHTVPSLAVEVQGPSVRVPGEVGVLHLADHGSGDCGASDVSDSNFFRVQKYRKS